MWNPRTAQDVRHRVERLGNAGLDSYTLRRELIAALPRAVPFDAACLSTLDPATNLLTSAVSSGLADRVGILLEAEYLHDDVGQYADLVLRPLPVGVLRHAVAGDVARSLRYREVLAPEGFSEELRVAFVQGERCWGVAGFMRGRRSRPFTHEEASFVASLSDVIAAGMRCGLVAEVARRVNVTVDGPAVILLDARANVESCTATARHWLAELASADEERLPPAVLALAAQQRRARSEGGQPGGTGAAANRQRHLAHLARVSA